MIVGEIEKEKDLLDKRNGGRVPDDAGIDPSAIIGGEDGEEDSICHCYKG